MFWGSASEAEDSVVEDKGLNLYDEPLNSKLLHLYNTECSEYKKKNEPKVLLFSFDYR